MSDIATKPLTVATTTASILVVLTISACGSGDGLPPVSDTRPSQDELILNDSGLMSDGEPVSPHQTDTLRTSIELISDGLIGGISVTGDGTIYTADLGSHIYKILPSGEATLLSREFDDPSGNLALANGDLLQSEWTNNRVYRVTPDGARTLFSETNLNGPVAIVQRPKGDFIVANSRGKFLARIPAEGGDAEIVLKDPRITQPNGLSIDPDGNIYVADLDSGHVFKWTPDGELTSIVELPGRGNAHNVYVNGSLYVTKIWDHVVYEVKLNNGTFGIVSGTGQPGYTDGESGAASIEEPNAIAAAPDGGTIYFNTHRGKMGREQDARVIVRVLTKADSTN